VLLAGIHNKHIPEPLGIYWNLMDAGYKHAGMTTIAKMPANYAPA
jgi:hypothetical protein